MFRNYLKISIRNLTKSKIYSFINIVGLAVGIACAVLVLLWAKYELSYDKFHKNSDRLYRVGFTTEQKDFYGFFQPGPLADYLKANFPEIECATNYADRNFKLSRETKGFFCTGSVVHPDFFKMFSFSLREGNPATALSIPSSVVISKSLANKIFGKEDPIGKTLKLDDQANLMITGIFTDVPKTSSIQFDFLIPFSSAPEFMRMWHQKSVNTYILLRKNASFENIDKKIAGVMNDHNPTWKNILFLFPMTKSHLYEPGETGPIIYIYIFSLLGILILIVACINFMNLSTARSEKRMKEIGIKKTVGSSRIELIKQFLTESLLLSFISLLIAIVLVEVTLPFMNDLLSIHIKMIYSGQMIFVLLGISIITGLLAGSYPALYLSSFSPIKVLSDKTSNKGEYRSSILRKTLVIAQFTFSVFIITCVLFITKQLNFIQSKNLGFNKEQVLMISTRGSFQQNVTILKEELRKFPFVKNVTTSATNLTNFKGSGTGPIDWEGKRSNKILEVGFNYVDEDFAKTFQVKMVQGRFFSKEFPTDLEEAFVINESSLKEMGIDNPINRSLTTWFGKKGRIIGVVKDFHTQSLREEMTPVVFILTKAANYLCLRISPKDIPGEIQTVAKKVKEFVPDDPFEFQFLDKEIDNQYKTEQMTDKLASSIAVLAVFISCLGLFGLVSFSSERRTKEIGIRKVLGASVLNVLFMLTKDLTKWVLISCFIACPLAYYAIQKWLQNFAYRIEITWWVFVIAGFIALIISILTVSFNAIRAATANPVKSLKYE